MTKSTPTECEFAVVGGGVVGLSIAYGLLQKSKKVTLFDEGDLAFRASRGNFGLVWVQGKGTGMPSYAKWTRASASRWQSFANQLSDETGNDLALQQRGGYSIFLDEASLEKQHASLDALKTELGGHYPFEVLGHNAIKKEEPHIGKAVVGAILHHEDGHLNPLLFLRSLVAATRQRGLTMVQKKVTSVVPQSDGFALHTADNIAHHCQKVVLASGLGTKALGEPLGFKVPIRPQRGQILITEKLPPIINRPSDEIRQVNEGGIQIGASAEEAGHDDSETTKTTAELANNAIKQYPILGKAQLIRSWGALRIMSPDGYPIYQQSTAHPGAYFTTCHSGITLAAAHAQLLPDWLCNDETMINELGLTFNDFSEDRFNV